MHGNAQRIAVVFATVIVGLACAPRKGASVETPGDVALRLVRMADQAYFEFGEGAQGELQDALIVLDDFQGMVIGAPSSLDTEERERLPVLWASRTSGLRNWQVEAMRNSTVVVSDLTRGRVSVHDAFAGPKRVDLRQVPRSATGDPPDSEVAEGATASVDVLDVRSIANLPWRPARLAITLVTYDSASNTVTVGLTRHGQQQSRDEEEELRFPRREARALDERHRKAATSGAAAVTLGPSPEAPRLAGLGVALVVPREVRSGKGHCVVHGVARMPLPPGAIVGPPPEGEEATGPRDEQAQAPAAVATLMLMVAEVDRPEPRHAAVQVPIHSEGPLSAGDVVEVAFSADLTAVLHGTLPPGTHQVYLVAGEYLSGPHPLSVGGG